MGKPGHPCERLERTLQKQPTYPRLESRETWGTPALGFENVPTQAKRRLEWATRQLTLCIFRGAKVQESYLEADGFVWANPSAS